MDKTFGIRYADGKPMIGDKLIDIIDDNIIIDEEVYIGTPGLWSLITDETPNEYDGNDYKRYKSFFTKLIPYTNIMIPAARHYPRANKSWKWNVNEYDDSDDTITEYQSVPEGDGILYHPIKGCRIYLQKNGRCFNVRAGRGIHLSPRPMIAGVSGDGLYIRPVLEYMMEKDYC